MGQSEEQNFRKAKINMIELKNWE